MKKAIPSLLLALLMLSCGLLKAQSFGLERPVTDRNLYFGFKVGINAMDMAYSKDRVHFVNHSVLYQRPFSKDALGCLVGGVTFERTLPRFSYGLEGMLTGTNAVAPADTTKFHYATQDTAYFLHVRVPIRLNLLKDKKVTPYLFVAPDVSTYIDHKIGKKGPHSIWNGMEVNWGSNNTNWFDIHLIAGAGMNVRIDWGDYEFCARLEAGYNLGLLNTIPKELKLQRKTRGWETTIGLSFPLFKNPSYQWFM
ncbi:MAG: hypothetical protein IKT08_05490 [Bacteroidales bacterium]|nr:hypothetical protein [Bacteroidales bacterium]